MQKVIRPTRVSYPHVSVIFTIVGDDKAWHAQTVNISKGGILAHFAEQPSFLQNDESGLPTMIDFQLSFYRLRKKVDGLADVIHLVSLPQGCDIGFSFVEFFEEDQEVWNELMDSLLQENGLEQKELG